MNGSRNVDNKYVPKRLTWSIPIGHLGHFYILAIILNAAKNIGDNTDLSFILMLCLGNNCKEIAL